MKIRWIDKNHLPKWAVLLLVRPLYVALHVLVGAELLGMDAWQTNGKLMAGAALSAFIKGLLELLKDWGGDELSPPPSNTPTAPTAQEPPTNEHD